MKPFIRDENDLESLSAHIPLLGNIPFVNKKDLRNGELLVRDGSKDMINESFRTIRTDLLNKCDADMKVIMFTSLEQGTGKTFTALNLAKSMVFLIPGKRIVLLDLDMRAARLSKMISNPHQGLSSFLNG